MFLNDIDGPSMMDFKLANFKKIWCEFHTVKDWAMSMFEQSQFYKGNVFFVFFNYYL